MDYGKFELFEPRPRKITEKFDRHNPVAPYYLTGLRTRGRGRIWTFKTWPLLGYSGATGAINPSILNGRGLILDAGCGDSPDCAWAMHRWGFKRGVKIDLYDIGQDNEYQARDLKKLEKGRVRFIKGDVCEVQPIEDETVDLVVSNAMIDLIPVEDRTLFYKQMWRVLKPGGVFSIAYVPLKAGYGWDGKRELRKLLGLGFRHLNSGRKSTVIVGKPSPTTQN